MSSKYFNTFELLSFELTDGFMAVFAEVASDGITDLTAYPLQAIGLAKVTTHRVKDGDISTDSDTHNDLVGPMLEDGVWDFANDCANFAGVMKVGGNVYAARGSLNRSEYKILRVNPESHDEEVKHEY